MHDEFQRVAARIETYRDWAIEVEKRLTAVKAIAPESGGDGELAKAKVVEAILSEIGVDVVEHHDAPDDRAEGGIRPNIVARIPGSGKAAGRLWLMSHMDVVPEGDRSKWSHDPWTVHVEDDKLYGRGVEDNQQGMVASLLLARALVEEKVTPAREVCLLFVADEEVGSTYGIQHLMKGDPLFSEDDLIIVPDGGLPDGSQIEVAEKSIMWVQFTVTGKTCHASMPDKGINAHRAAAHLVVALDELHDKFPDEDPVFDPPTSTFEPTKREPNVGSVNILPGEDVFYLDCRVLPQHPLEQVEREIALACASVEDRFNVQITTEAPQREEAAPPTSVDAPVVHALKEAVKNIYDVDARPEGIGGGTVAAYIRRAGYPVVVWSRMDETMHSPDEYVILSNILGDAKVFAHLATH